MLWVSFSFLIPTINIADVTCGLICVFLHDMLDACAVQEPALFLKAVVLGVSLALPWMLLPFLVTVHDVPASAHCHVSSSSAVGMQ